MSESPPGSMPADEAAETCREVADRVRSAVVMDAESMETVLTGALARGHVLVEDVPGTGKTLLAKVLAGALGLSFNRIQFTPDLLPADITGATIYNEETGEFEFSKGPIFNHVILADEINRAPPKTQAALLEAMEERQVTVDGETHPLPDPFFVIATQNPIEQEGTFRLPEAERDRFIVKLSLGYPDVEGEMELLERRSNRRTITPSVDAVTDADTVRLLQGTPEDVSVEERVRRYAVALARATREDQRTEVGVSPRGVQRFFEAARARAAIAGRKYVAPDDVKAIARPVMAHRLVLTTQASVEGVEPASVVDDALQRVQVPAVAAEDEPPSASGDEAGEEGEAAGEANVGDAAVDDAAVDDAAAGDAAEEPVGEPAAGQEAAETVPPEPSAGTTAETPPGERVADESEGEDD